MAAPFGVRAYSGTGRRAYRIDDLRQRQVIHFQTESLPPGSTTPPAPTQQVYSSTEFRPLAGRTSIHSIRNMTLSTVKPSVDSRALPPHSQIPLPITWQPVVEAHLKTEEKVLAWLEIDLNARLRFAKGLVVLTSQRLLARTEDDA